MHNMPCLSFTKWCVLAIWKVIMCGMILMTCVSIIVISVELFAVFCDTEVALSIGLWILVGLSIWLAIALAGFVAMYGWEILRKLVSCWKWFCCASADLAVERVHFSLISTETESSFIYMQRLIEHFSNTSIINPTRQSGSIRICQDSILELQTQEHALTPDTVLYRTGESAQFLRFATVD